MNDAEQIETLKALTEVAREREEPQKRLRLASVRVSPGSYLAVASVLTFSSALLLKSERDLFAIVVVGIAWLIVPLLALTDRIEFDGETLRRRGPAPLLLRLTILGRQKQLKVADFEKVDTQALRTLRRGGRVGIIATALRWLVRVRSLSLLPAGVIIVRWCANCFPEYITPSLTCEHSSCVTTCLSQMYSNREVEALQLAPAEVLYGAY